MPSGYVTTQLRGVAVFYTLFSIEVVGVQPKQVDFSIIVTRSFILLRKKKDLKYIFHIYKLLNNFSVNKLADFFLFFNLFCIVCCS